MEGGARKFERPGASLVEWGSGERPRGPWDQERGEKHSMATDIRLKEALPEITEAVVATYTECNRTSHLGHKPLPSRDAVVAILVDFLDLLYPGIWRRQNLHMANAEYHVGDLIDGLHDQLTLQISRALRHEYDC